MFYKQILPIALAGMLILAGCTSNPEDPPPPVPGVSIRYVAVQELPSGQFQLGLNVEAAIEAGIAGFAVISDGDVIGTIPVNEATNLHDDVYEFFLDIDDPGDEQHTAFAQAIDKNGESITSDPKTWFRNMRGLLVEVGTSANCTPCAGSNEYYHFQTEGDVAKLRYITVKYHVWWPRPTDSLYKLAKHLCEPRIKGYLPENNQWIAPFAFVNGTHIRGASQKWIEQAMQDEASVPEADIHLSGIDNGNSVDVGIDVTLGPGVSYNDLRLLTVVTESEIHYNDGNAEFVHHDVMKDMLPDQNGESVNLTPGQTTSFVRTVDIKPGSVKENMHVVVFIQNGPTGVVLQAKRLDL